jgi:hypothetical protein
MSEHGRSTLALSVAVLAIGIALVVGGMVLAGSGPFADAQQPTTTPDSPEDGANTANGSDGSDGTDDGSAGTDGATGTNGSDAGGPANATVAQAGIPAGEPLAGSQSLGDAAVTIEGVEKDEIGFATAVGDVNGDGVGDVVVGAPLRNASGPSSGAVEVFFGPVEGETIASGDADVRLTGQSGIDWAGNSLAVADVNADGTHDLVVGAPRTDRTADNAGTVYVVYGGSDLGGEISLAEADARVDGVEAGGLAGYTVAAGNVTGDAAADLVVGAPRTGEDRGTVYVVDGADVGPNASVDDATAAFDGEGPDSEAGWGVAVARNVTGDGPDVVVGARRDDTAGNNAGAAYVVGAPFEDGSLGDAELVLRGPEDGAFAGWAVAAPGDVSGDGAPDVVVGAPLAGSGGEVYVADGGTGERSLGNAVGLRAAGSGDRAGWAVAGAGDVTCDGASDLVVGAPEHAAGGENAGAYHVVAGANETTDANAAPLADGGTLGNATATLVGVDAGDQAGRTNDVGVVRAGNRTGLVLGAPFGETPQTVHVVGVECQDG